MMCHVGVIREEGGKMYMLAHQWNEAYNEFYEGFAAYQVRHTHHTHNTASSFIVRS